MAPVRHAGEPGKSVLHMPAAFELRSSLIVMSEEYFYQNQVERVLTLKTRIMLHLHGETVKTSIKLCSNMG